MWLSFASARGGDLPGAAADLNPDGTGEHLDAGWHPNYWEPLTRRFS